MGRHLDTSPEHKMFKAMAQEAVRIIPENELRSSFTDEELRRLTEKIQT